MERKVGEIFEYNEEWYQCIVQPKGTEGQSCSICSMNFGGKCPIHVIECAMEGRSDGKSVIFKKLEKVGEPFKSMGNCYQVYKTYCEPTNVGLGSSYDGSKVVIKIKQNKENMEEKKLNFKPFDLEAAKAGKPVCTRDGRKARIICFDAKCNKPIVALIYDCNKETVLQYLENGRFFVDQIDKYDLMMFPQKKEGWINLCKNNHGDTLAVGVFPNSEEAVSNCPPSYLSTIKIEWEE